MTREQSSDDGIWTKALLDNNNDDTYTSVDGALNDIVAISTSTTPTSTTAMRKNQCEFVFARQSFVDGKLIKKGQKCIKEAADDTKFCSMHAYADSRRKRKLEETPAKKKDESRSDSEPSPKSLKKRIEELEAQVNTLQRQVNLIQETLIVEKREHLNK